MNKTDDILEKLKNVEKPQIDMTEEIMSLLPSSPEGKSLTPVPSPLREGRSINFMPVIRAVLSLAAMWIVGLFFVLQIESSDQAEINNVENQYPSPQPAYCTEGTPREILMCYMERREAQPHIYQQLKQKSYENQ